MHALRLHAETGSCVIMTTGKDPILAPQAGRITSAWAGSEPYKSSYSRCELLVGLCSAVHGPEQMKSSSSGAGAVGSSDSSSELCGCSCACLFHELRFRVSIHSRRGLWVLIEHIDGFAIVVHAFMP